MVLATFAGFLVLEDVILLIWGTDPYLAFRPLELMGSMNYRADLRQLHVHDDRLVVPRRIRTLVRSEPHAIRQSALAVVFDREVSMAMGINVTKIFLITFMIGTFLALGGAYYAPIISVQPGIGVEVIVLAFAVVVIGGMGSIPGA